MITDLGAAKGRRSKTDVYLQTLYALILRDMRTRFGGSHFGFSVAVLWPVAHVFVVVTILTFRNLPSPMSGGTALFVATGAVPCLLFQYVSREIIKGYSLNKPLTYYPQVKIFDVILSRIIVEIVSGFMGAMVVLALLSIFSSQVLPADPAMAMISYFMAIALGIGIGFINVGLVAFFPGWTMGYVLFCIVNYMIAGVVFMPHYLPAEIYYYLKFNPVVDIIELMRLSYDTSLAVEINYIYVSFFIVLTLLVGLMMERFILRRMS